MRKCLFSHEWLRLRSLLWSFHVHMKWLQRTKDNTKLEDPKDKSAFFSSALLVSRISRFSFQKYNLFHDRDILSSKKKMLMLFHLFQLQSFYEQCVWQQWFSYQLIVMSFGKCNKTFANLNVTFSLPNVGQVWFQHEGHLTFVLKLRQPTVPQAFDVKDSSLHFQMARVMVRCCITWTSGAWRNTKWKRGENLTYMSIEHMSAKWQ